MKPDLTKVLAIVAAAASLVTAGCGPQPEAKAPAAENVGTAVQETAEAPPTIEDVARPDYVDHPDRILSKVRSDSLLKDLRLNTHTVAQGVQNKTNAVGQYDDREHPLAKIPGRTRVMFIGDDFTCGWGLELDYSFVKQTERLLGDQRWEIINLGVPGGNTIAEVVRFEQAGLKFSPDLVILMYHLNDAQSAADTALGNEKETFDALSRYYQGELSGNDRDRVVAFLRERDYPLDPAWNRRETSWRNRRYLTSHYLPLYWNPLQGALKKLEELGRRRGFKVLVCIIPEIDQAWATYPFDDLHVRVAAEMRSHGFGVMDLKPILSTFPNKDLMLRGTSGLTSAYANRIIAQALADRLTAR